ncbi:MAG: LysM peptidoglycan-binding domain-containing protein [Verrucomicrobiota bacterium]
MGSRIAGVLGGVLLFSLLIAMPCAVLAYDSALTCAGAEGPSAPLKSITAPETAPLCIPILNSISRNPSFAQVAVPLRPVAAAASPQAQVRVPLAPPLGRPPFPRAAGKPAPQKPRDRVLSAGEVDLQVAGNRQEEDPDGEKQDDFFDNASLEVEKGKDGVFAGLTDPIEKFIRYFQNRGRDRFQRYLARSGKYAEMMRGILARYGLPEDLIYLALIESGFSPKAYSSAKAAGPWQFIAGTGRRYGLRIDWWADERRDAEKSTHAAASYLKELYGMFDSWPLAAAAYNAGEGKIIKAVHRYKSEDFAELIRYRYLKQETKDYVPKMLAALTIAKEPEKYGFGDVEYEEPLDLRTVMVPGGTDLAAVARILEVPYEDLQEWNPALRRFCTPPTVDQYELRLSADAARLAEERMEEIRTEAKVTFLQHDVRKKETLSGLARKYGTSTAVLKELNGLKRDSLSRVSRLVIPVTGLSGEESVPGKEIAPDQLTMAHMRVEENARRGRHRGGRTHHADAGDTIRVRKGDTLSSLAKKHGVSVGELARANGLRTNGVLKAGTRIALPEAAPKFRAKASSGKREASAPPSRSGRKATRYKVHRGDTLEKIARVYGVKVSDLVESNRLKQGQPLRLGAVLVIPSES